MADGVGWKAQLNNRPKEKRLLFGEAKRYKPIILQEHDAEPRSLKAILDVKTNGIYILETTKEVAEYMGMTIEDRNDDGESEG